MASLRGQTKPIVTKTNSEFPDQLSKNLLHELAPRSGSTRSKDGNAVTDRLSRPHARTCYGTPQTIAGDRGIQPLDSISYCCSCFFPNTQLTERFELLAIALSIGACSRGCECKLQERHQ
jgi:hypothetical protein